MPNNVRYADHEQAGRRAHRDRSASCTAATRSSSPSSRCPSTSRDRAPSSKALATRDRWLLHGRRRHARSVVAVLRRRDRVVRSHRWRRGEEPRDDQGAHRDARRREQEARASRALPARDDPPGSRRRLHEPGLPRARANEASSRHAREAASTSTGLGVGSSRALTGTRRFTASSNRRSRGFFSCRTRSCSARATSRTSASTRRCSTAATACSATRSCTRAPPRACGSSSATAFPFRNNDVDDLEDKLRRSRSARFRAIRHRRRVPVRRTRRRARGHLCARREVRCDGRARRFARRRRARSDRARHPRAARRDRRASTS